MKCTIFLVLFSLLCSTINAQTIAVRDAATNDPISNVGVYLLQSGEGYTTDAKGEVKLDPLAAEETLRFSVLGYASKILTVEELESSYFIVRLEKSALKLDEIIVSANRWRQSSGNIPSKVITLSARDNALHNPQTAADLLNVSGKVFIQKSQQGGGSPMIRGFATNRLIYAVDGVRMNTAIFRGGNIQNVINLDPFATESTEVVFGPASVNYGSDAIGGVMSFQTLPPSLSTDNQTQVEGTLVGRLSSANNERTGHFDINIGGKKWAFLSSVSYWDYDHLRQGSHGPDDYLKETYADRIDGRDTVLQSSDPRLQIPSAYSQLNLMQKVLYKPNENWEFNYGFHYSETSSYGRYDRHNRMRNGTLRYAVWNYGPQQWMMNHFSLAHKREKGWYDELNLSLAHQFFEESRIDRNFRSTRLRNRVENVHAYSLNLDLKKQLNQKHALFYGLEAVHNDIQSSGQITDIESGLQMKGPSRYPESGWTSLAAYINEQWQLTPKFSIQSGLRYNHFLLNADFTSNQDFYPFPFETAEINSGALTGSIGSVYRPTDHWVFKLNLGTAFRSPNVDDIGKVFDSEPGSVVVPNPNLQAEYAYNADIGIARIIGDRVKLDLTAYYTRLQNAHVRRDFQLNGRDSILFDGQLSKVQALQNAAKANVFGIQAGIEIHIFDSWRISSDLNYQRGREETDDGEISPSRHAPPLFGVSRIRYQKERFTLELNSQYQGQYDHDQLSLSERSKEEIYALDVDGNTFAPSWYTLNFKARFHILDYFSLSAGIENITDQRYRPYSSGISGAGRNFILSGKLDF